MVASLDNYFAFNHAAMTVKSERLGLIAGNIANASTPGFKAKELDFASLLRKSFAPVDAPFQIDVGMTNAGHQGGAQFTDWTDIKSAELFTVPLAPSLDGNTVEMHREHTAFMDNAMRYQASTQFLDSKIRALRTAIKGE